MLVKPVLVFSVAALLAFDASVVQAKQVNPSGRGRISAAVKTFVEKHPRAALVTLGSVLFGGGLVALSGHHVPWLSGAVTTTGLSLMASQTAGALANLRVRDRRLQVEPVAAKPTHYADAALTWSMMMGLAGGLFFGGRSLGDSRLGEELRLFGVVGAAYNGINTLYHSMTNGRGTLFGSAVEEKYKR